MNLTGRLYSFYNRHKRVLFLCLTLICGVCLLTPTIDFQHWLSQGDHGRDLYSFKKTFEGGLPYRDYQSSNGPLMPFYYSLFFWLLGVSVQSVLWGYAILVLSAGAVLYL